jgi:hypothetical protein
MVVLSRIENNQTPQDQSKESSAMELEMLLNMSDNDFPQSVEKADI